MAAEVPTWNLEESEELENPWGVPATPEEIRQSLASAPKPKKPMKVNVAEAEFWRTRHVPPGSVLVFTDPTRTDAEGPKAAVLVTETLSLATGLWLHVRSLGGENAKEKKKVEKYFKGHRRRVHICHLSDSGHCAEDDVDAFHLERFEWFPPGDFTADWLTSPAKKLVREGIAMAAQAVETEPGHFGPPRKLSGRAGSLSRTPDGLAGAPGPTSSERLSALKGRDDVRDGRRVSFAANLERGSTPPVAGNRKVATDGTGGGAAASFPPLLPAERCQAGGDGDLQRPRGTGAGKEEKETQEPGGHLGEGSSSEERRRGEEEEKEDTQQIRLQETIISEEEAQEHRFRERGEQQQGEFQQRRESNGPFEAALPPQPGVCLPNAGGACGGEAGSRWHCRRRLRGLRRPKAKDPDLLPAGPSTAAGSQESGLQRISSAGKVIGPLDRWSPCRASRCATARLYSPWIPQGDKAGKQIVI